MAQAEMFEDDDAPESERDGSGEGDEGLAVDMMESAEDDTGVGVDLEKYDELLKAARDASEDEYKLILKQAEELLADAPGYFEDFKHDAEHARATGQLLWEKPLEEADEGEDRTEDDIEEDGIDEDES